MTLGAILAPDWGMDDTLNVPALELAHTLSDDYVTRYLSGKTCLIFQRSLLSSVTAIGLVVILYDTFLTIPEEYELVWRSKANFAKYAFLGNKYIVILLLVLETVSKFFIQ